MSVVPIRYLEMNEKSLARLCVNQPNSTTRLETLTVLVGFFFERHQSLDLDRFKFRLFGLPILTILISRFTLFTKSMFGRMDSDHQMHSTILPHQVDNIK